MACSKTISVIVPVYKVEQYLERCVRSICQQTYPHLEIILVDDGSPDTCGELCENFAKEDARIRVVHKQNGGLSSARNAGIEVAQGDYIAFVDSDDWIDPPMLEILLRLCEEQDAEIAECSYRNHLPEGRKKEETACTGLRLEVKPAQAIEGNLDWKFFKPVAWNKLYKKEVIGSIRYPEGKLHEDEFTTHKFYLMAKKVVYADISLYNYDCTREGSITAKFRLKNLDACEAFHEKVHLVWENPALHEIDQKMCNAYSYILFDRLSKCARAGLHGPLLDSTVKTAVEDFPALKAHGINDNYVQCFEVLAQKGVKACARLWRKVGGY